MVRRGILTDKRIVISQNTLADLKGPKRKYNMHYGCCTGRLLGPPHGTTPNAVIANKNKTEIP